MAFRTIPSVVAQLAARRAVLGPQADLMTSFAQGLQQGQALQNLPQTLQDQQQALALKKLQQQLAVATMQQKLIDLQNPDAAAAREVEKQLMRTAALHPELGIGPGIGETVGQPSALTPEQQATLIDPLATAGSGIVIPHVTQDQLVPTASFIIPTAKAGPDITPIAFGNIQTGLSFNPSIPAAATAAKQSARIADIQARAAASGIPGQVIVDTEGNPQFFPTRSFGGVAPVATEVKNAAGESLKIPAKAGAAKGGMAANQQANLLIKYGSVKDIVGNLEDPKFQDEQGNTDYSKLAIGIGQAERSQKIADLNAKQQMLSPALKKEAAGYISSQKDLENLKTTLLDLDSRGADPGVIQNAFAVMANNPSEGFFSSLSRQFANSQLTDDTRKKESVRSALESAVTKSLSGTAVSKGEAQRLTGLLPKADDSLKILIDKTAGLEIFNNNKLSGLTEAASLGVTPPPSSTGNNDPLGLFK